MSTPHSFLKEIEAEVKHGQGPCIHPCGIAISDEIANELELEVGDPAVVTGQRETVGVVESIEPLSGKAVYLGGMVTRNTQPAETLKLRRLDQVVVADKVVLTMDSNTEVEAQEIKRSLKGLFVCTGDELEVPGKGLLGGRAIVCDTKPGTRVQIGEGSEVVFKRAISPPGWTADFASLGGFKEVLATLKDFELRLVNQQLLERYSSGPIKGVLVHGPQGVGKSLLLRSLVKESRVNSILVSASELAGLDHGETERRIREIFAEAKQQAPSLILIDELDAICPKRGDYSQPEEKRVVSVVLGILDDLMPEHRVMVVATASNLDVLDPALRRSGRFDKEIEISLPNTEERKEILEIYTSAFPLEEGVNLDTIAEATHGFVGSDLQLLSRNALWHAIRKQVSVKDLERGLRKQAGALRRERIKGLTVEEVDFLNCIKEIDPSVGRAIIADVPKVAWQSVGGYEDVKSQLERDVVAIWQNRVRARNLGVEVPRGILLWGEPGTGKTHLAKALATRVNSKVIIVRASSLLSKWLGEYEQNIARVFQVARRTAPVVVIVDEVDTIAAKRGGGAGEGTRALDSGLNVLLQELDGVEESRDVFLVCITNRLDMLDEAFIRSGRIGRKIHIGKPDERARREIFNIHLRQVKARLEGIDLDELARLTPGLVGADIKEIVRQALSEAFHELLTSTNPREFVVRKEHFDRALETMREKSEGGRNETVSFPSV